MLKNNLSIAVNEVIKEKEQDPQIRARIETCVNLESVKVYIIKKEMIQKVISIADGSISEEVKVKESI